MAVEEALAVRAGGGRGKKKRMYEDTEKGGDK